MQKKNFFKAATALTLVIGIASWTAIAGAQEDTRTAGKSTASEIYKALNLFGDVFEQVRANYVEPMEDKKLIEYALNGMLSSLDPHSSYMNEEETKDMSVQNKGEFGGLGIEVTMESGAVKVVSPIDETPAARAGLQSGDLIVEIDSKPVMGMTLQDAVNTMRGRVGTEINLTVVREGEKEPLKFKLVRDVIKIRSVRSRVEKDNVGYIRVTTFNEQTSPGLKKAFEDVKKEAGDKLIGYVLDLRNNPGGLLEEAISVSDTFLDKGEIVSTRGRNPNDIERDNAKPGDLADGMPVVVLINAGSASASEIVAGALQDHKRAVIMGTKSYGKGSVQTLFRVPGGGTVRLTTARYYTPSGKSIQAKGIMPDITVERAKVVAEKSAFSEIHEADLKGALKNPQEGDKETPEPTLQPDDQEKKPEDKKTDKKDGEESSKDDYQLMRAVDLLQGISLYKGTTAPAPAPAEPATEKTVK